MIGPVYAGEIAAGVARLLGRARRGAASGRRRRLRRLHRPRPGDRPAPGATRCCASPASGCCCTAISTALVEALREVPRSRPFESLEELERLEVPALVVASHDDADPGHPYATAAAYAERLPRARLVSEGEGESPLAWQGGKLSREIAAFYAEAHLVFIELMKLLRPEPGEAALRIIAFVATLRDRRRHLHRDRRLRRRRAGLPRRRRRLPDRRQQLLLAHRRGQHRDLRDRRLRACCWRRAFFASDAARFGGFARRARRLRLQHLPDLPGDLHDRSDLPVVRGQRGADDDPLPAQRHPADRLRRDHDAAVPERR